MAVSIFAIFALGGVILFLLLLIGGIVGLVLWRRSLRERAANDAACCMVSPELQAVRAIAAGKLIEQGRELGLTDDWLDMDAKDFEERDLECARHAIASAKDGPTA